MKKINAVIIDDEFHARENLKILVTEFCPQINIVGEADGVENGLKEIESKKPQLLFLDIRMPSGAEGFELLDLIPDKKIRIIFITAFKEYAIKAFKANAIDYLLKPVDIEELKQAVSKIELNKYTEQENNSYIDQLKALTSTIGIPKDKLSISNRKGIKIVNQQDIVRLEADGNCTILFYNDGTKYLDTRTLKVYESLLNKNLFFRVHKSHIVNLNFVKEYNRELRPVVTMIKNVKIPVSRLKVRALISKLKSL
jgi:two-component system LytT family response regulator